MSHTVSGSNGTVLVVPLYSSASSPMVNGLIGYSTHKQRRKLTRFCHMSDINRGQAEGGGGGGGPNQNLFICAIQ